MIEFVILPCVWQMVEGQSAAASLVGCQVWCCGFLECQPSPNIMFCAASSLRRVALSCASLLLRSHVLRCVIAAFLRLHGRLTLCEVSEFIPSLL